MARQTVLAINSLATAWQFCSAGCATICESFNTNTASPAAWSKQRVIRPGPWSYPRR